VTATEFRAILRDLGVTQTAVAEALGVTRRAVVYWCAGKRRIPAAAIRLVRQAEERGYWSQPPPNA
jgi:plasmid maintenance system antidote protein VapI